MNALLDKLKISIFWVLLLSLTSSVPAWALGTSVEMRGGIKDGSEVLTKILNSKVDLTKAVSLDFFVTLFERYGVSDYFNNKGEGGLPLSSKIELNQIRIIPSDVKDYAQLVSIVREKLPKDYQDIYFVIGLERTPSGPVESLATLDPKELQNLLAGGSLLEELKGKLQVYFPSTITLGARLKDSTLISKEDKNQKLWAGLVKESLIDLDKSNLGHLFPFFGDIPPPNPLHKFRDNGAFSLDHLKKSFAMTHFVGDPTTENLVSYIRGFKGIVDSKDQGLGLEEKAALKAEDRRYFKVCADLLEEAYPPLSALKTIVPPRTLAKAENQKGWQLLIKDTLEKLKQNRQRFSVFEDKFDFFLAHLQARLEGRMFVGQPSIATLITQIRGLSGYVDPIDLRTLGVRARKQIQKEDEKHFRLFAIFLEWSNGFPSPPEGNLAPKVLAFKSEEALDDFDVTKYYTPFKSEGSLTPFDLETYSIPFKSGIDPLLSESFEDFSKRTKGVDPLLSESVEDLLQRTIGSVESVEDYFQRTKGSVESVEDSLQKRTTGSVESVEDSLQRIMDSGESAPEESFEDFLQRRPMAIGLGESAEDYLQRTKGSVESVPEDAFEDYLQRTKDKLSKEAKKGKESKEDRQDREKEIKGSTLPETSSREPSFKSESLATWFMDMEQESEYPKYYNETKYSWNQAFNAIRGSKGFTGLSSSDGLMKSYLNKLQSIYRRDYEDDGEAPCDINDLEHFLSWINQVIKSEQHAQRLLNVDYFTRIHNHLHKSRMFLQKKILFNRVSKRILGNQDFLAIGSDPDLMPEVLNDLGILFSNNIEDAQSVNPSDFVSVCFWIARVINYEILWDRFWNATYFTRILYYLQENKENIFNLSERGTSMSARREVFEFAKFFKVFRTDKALFENSNDKEAMEEALEALDKEMSGYYETQQLSSIEQSFVMIEDLISDYEFDENDMPHLPYYKIIVALLKEKDMERSKQREATWKLDAKRFSVASSKQDFNLREFFDSFLNDKKFLRKLKNEKINKNDLRRLEMKIREFERLPDSSAATLALINHIGEAAEDDEDQEDEADEAGSISVPDYFTILKYMKEEVLKASLLEAQVDKEALKASLLEDQVDEEVLESKPEAILPLAPDEGLPVLEESTPIFIDQRPLVQAKEVFNPTAFWNTFLNDEELDNKAETKGSMNRALTMIRKEVELLSTPSSVESLLDIIQEIVRKETNTVARGYYEIIYRHMFKRVEESREASGFQTTRAEALGSMENLSLLSSDDNDLTDPFYVDFFNSLRDENAFHSELTLNNESLMEIYLENLRLRIASNIENEYYNSPKDKEELMQCISKVIKSKDMDELTNQFFNKILKYIKDWVPTEEEEVLEKSVPTLKVEAVVESVPTLKVEAVVESVPTAKEEVVVSQDFGDSFFTIFFDALFDDGPFNELEEEDALMFLYLEELSHEISDKILLENVLEPTNKEELIKLIEEIINEDVLAGVNAQNTLFFKKIIEYIKTWELPVEEEVEEAVEEAVEEEVEKEVEKEVDLKLLLEDKASKLFFGTFFEQLLDDLYFDRMTYKLKNTMRIIFYFDKIKEGLFSKIFSRKVVAQPKNEKEMLALIDGLIPEDMFIKDEDLNISFLKEIVHYIKTGKVPVGKSEDSKAEDSKAEDSKAEDGKPENSKAEDSKPEDSKAEDSQKNQNSFSYEYYLNSTMMEDEDFEGIFTEEEFANGLKISFLKSITTEITRAVEGSEISEPESLESLLEMIPLLIKNTKNPILKSYLNRFLEYLEEEDEEEGISEVVDALFKGLQRDSDFDSKGPSGMMILYLSRLEERLQRLESKPQDVEALLTIMSVMIEKEKKNPNADVMIYFTKIFLYLKESLTVEYDPQRVLDRLLDSKSFQKLADKDRLRNTLAFIKDRLKDPETKLPKNSRELFSFIQAIHEESLLSSEKAVWTDFGRIVRLLEAQESSSPENILNSLKTDKKPEEKQEKPEEKQEKPEEKQEITEEKQEITEEKQEKPEEKQEKTEKKQEKTKEVFYDYDNLLDNLQDDKTFKARLSKEISSQEHLDYIRRMLESLPNKPKDIQTLILWLSEVVMDEFKSHQYDRGQFLMELFQYLVEVKFSKEYTENSVKDGYDYQNLFNITQNDPVFKAISERPTLMATALKIMAGKIEVLGKRPENFETLMFWINNIIRDDIINEVRNYARVRIRMFRYFEEKAPEKTKRKSAEAKGAYQTVFDDILGKDNFNELDLSGDDLRDLSTQIKKLGSDGPEDLEALMLWIDKNIHTEIMGHNKVKADSLIKIFRYVRFTFSIDYNDLFDTVLNKELKASSEILKSKLANFPNIPKNFQELMSLIRTVIKDQLVAGSFKHATSTSQILKSLEDWEETRLQAETDRYDYKTLLAILEEDEGFIEKARGMDLTPKTAITLLKTALDDLNNRNPQTFEEFTAWNDEISHSLKVNQQLLKSSIITFINDYLKSEFAKQPKGQSKLQEFLARLAISSEEKGAEVEWAETVNGPDFLNALKEDPELQKVFTKDTNRKGRNPAVALETLKGRFHRLKKTSNVIKLGELIKWIRDLSFQSRQNNLFATAEDFRLMAEYLELKDGGSTDEYDYKKVFKDLLNNRSFLKGKHGSKRGLIKKALFELSDEVTLMATKPKNLNDLLGAISLIIEHRKTLDDDTTYLNLVSNYLKAYNMSRASMTQLPLRLRSFDKVETYQEALLTQPVVLDGQFQKASYYDYSKQKLVKGVVKIAKDLPLMGLTFSLNSIHTPYVSELIKGVMGEWAASIELYQAEVMKDHTDINAYIAFKYQHLPKEERLGAFKTDAQMAALAPRTLTELRELRTALAGYLEIPAVQEAMQTADELNVSLHYLSPFLGGKSLSEYAEGDVIKGKALLEATRDQFLEVMDIAIEELSSDQLQDTLYMVLNRLPKDEGIEKLTARLKPSLTRAYS